MSKFKVGDWVTGANDYYYGITNSDMTIGEVTSVREDGYITVRVIEHKITHHIGYKDDGLNPEKFILIED